MNAMTDRRPPRCADHRAQRKAGCQPCRRYDAWGKRDRRRRAAAGTWETYRPVDEACTHLRQLTDVHGWTCGQIAARAGLCIDDVQDIRGGRRTRGILAVTHDAIMGVPLGPPPSTRLVPAVGVHRMIRALCRHGWTYNHIAGQFGATGRTLDSVMHRDQVTVAMRAKIAAAYRALAVTPGPSATARARAAAPKPDFPRGWPGPMCWTPETIDDPAAEPDWGDAPTAFRRSACKAAACPILELRHVHARRWQYDAAAVEQALLGIRTARQLTTAERIEAVTRLVRRGEADDVIAARLRWGKGEAVTAFRVQHRIMPNLVGQAA
ncbi:hypothetical protein GCM10018962_77500 [Dactylosporangium matsuzakiense]|uniref:hypothetical protein n=1 Tax=Dactylosporangium matsuzakiense TaxID=53360 RepID=UPI0031ECD799